MTVNPEFFGRRSVLNLLCAHLDAVAHHKRGRILAIRGRRQVGKSTVVERFVTSAEVPYAFVTGVFGAGSRQQLRNASLAISESTRPLPDQEFLTHPIAGSWREWFGRLAIAARQGPVIVVLDEFPWLGAADAALEGELQVAWDRLLEKLPVLLILVGSNVAMMDRLASHGRPLFGRVQPVVISALNPAELALAVPNWSAAAVFDAYLVTGGYPRLVSDLAQSGAVAVADYVHSALRDAFSPLLTTARLTLDAEFPDSRTAYQVLSAIGAEDTARPRFKDVLSAISDPAERKKSETAVIRALRLLTEDARLIDRELPAWASASTKLRRYRINDPYLRFWFRYAERQLDRISRGRADLAIAHFDRDWPSWRGRSIEPIIRGAVLRLATRLPQLAEVESVQPWWVRDGQVEIDVVAGSATTTVLLGTIKWRASGGVNARELAALRAQRALVPRASTAILAVISPEGPPPPGADLTLTAADLLQAWD